MYIHLSLSLYIYIYIYRILDVADLAAWMFAADPGLGRRSRVLDICCGNSELAQILGACCGHVVAVDWSHSVIEEMIAAGGQRNVEYRQGDVRELPKDLVPDASFDAVVSKAGLDAMMDLDGGLGVESAVREACRALRPGGRTTPSYAHYVFLP